jgi:putative drug exporter of the RND superfamily
MRRPLPIAVAVVAFLVLLGTPFLGVRFGLPDDRVLPAQAEGRQVAEAVRTSFEPSSAAGEDLVAAVRDLPAPLGAQVAGPSAQLVDTKASLFGHLPAAAAVIALVTFVLLFLMTGSVVIPLKALVLNLLSLTAVYGAMVYVFQDGHLAGLLGFTPTGTIDTSMPVLLFCIAFGLSMDYEVFLLSRIKEEHDRTGDSVAAVAVGLERTGRIVTTAAALLAILVDATLIRALLVPAFMRLAGRANWWAPAPLRRLHARFGLAEAPGASGA